MYQIKNDRNMENVSNYIFEKGSYPAVHPITKNFFWAFTVWFLKLKIHIGDPNSFWKKYDLLF